MTAAMIVIVMLVLALAIQHRQNAKHQRILIEYANMVSEYAKAIDGKCELVSQQHDLCKDLVSNVKRWYEITGMQYSHISTQIDKIKEEIKNGVEI